MAIQYIKLSNTAADTDYPEALANAEGDDAQIDLGSAECTGFGEVKLVGGWCLCVLGLNGEPIYAYVNPREGWLRLPPAEFERVR